MRQLEQGLAERHELETKLSQNTRLKNQSDALKDKEIQELRDQWQCKSVEVDTKTRAINKSFSISNG